MHAQNFVLAFIVGLLAAGCGADKVSGPNEAPSQSQFFARLDGASTVPPTDSNGTGAAFVELLSDRDSSVVDQVFYSFQISGLTGTTFVVLRRGVEGQNGEILLTFCGLLEYRACPAGSRLEFAGTVEATALRGSRAKMDEIRRAIESGQTYIEVETKNHAAGELRGQLHPR